MISERQMWALFRVAEREGGRLVVNPNADGMASPAWDFAVILFGQPWPRPLDGLPYDFRKTAEDDGRAVFYTDAATKRALITSSMCRDLLDVGNGDLYCAVHSALDNDWHVEFRPLSEANTCAPEGGA